MSYYLCPLYAPLLFLPISSFLLFSDKAGVKQVVSRKKTYAFSKQCVFRCTQKYFKPLLCYTTRNTFQGLELHTIHFGQGKFYIQRTKNTKF